MVRTGAQSGGHRHAHRPTWLIPPGLAGAAFVVAVAAVSADVRMAVAMCGVAGTAAVALTAAEAGRRGRALAVARAQFAERESALRERLAERDAVTVRLAAEVLPEAVGRLQCGELAEDVMADANSWTGLSPELRAAHEAVLRSVVKAVEAEQTLRESAQRACVNIARRVQAIVHRQAHDLREMEDRHGQDPEVFGDLLRLDHGTTLIGRLADSIAVAGGARPGRQWSRPVSLFSVLRGAMSRILDYQRVELHSVAQVAVVGPAVEPLIHALAELLDNATRHSPPQTPVHLTAVEVQAGVAVEIEDGGVSLSEEARSRAERMLMHAQYGIDLTDLGETPQLGLAVVGRLSRACNFQVSLRSSAYGGVRAVLVVPQELLTTVPATDETPAVTELTPSGLPKRRGRTMAEPGRPRQAATGTPVPATPAPHEAEQAQPGIWLAAFQTGLAGGAQPGPPPGDGSDTAADSGGQS